MRLHIIWGPACLCFGTTLIFSLLFYYRAPFHDHWSIVPLYSSLQSGNLGVSDLFALHGNHWHASAYLLQLGLSPLTGMGHWAESLASVIIAGFGFFALVRLLVRTDTPKAMAWLIGSAAFFFFSLDQAGNWLWGWQVAVFLNMAGALWAIERLSAGAPTVLNTGLAVMATAVSIYAFATGWVLIPIGWVLLSVYGGWRSHQGRFALLIWTGFAAAMAIHFFLAKRAMAGLETQTGLPPLADINTLLGLTHYTLNFLASPIVRFARDISVPITLLGAGLTVLALRRLYQKDPKRVWTRTAPLLALAAYAMGAGLLTALGRWEMYGVKQAFVSRYITFGTLYWIAVFTLAGMLIAERRDQSHRVLLGVLSLLFILKIGNIPSVVQKSIRISNEVKVAAATLAETYPGTDPQDYAVLQSPHQTIEADLAVLHEHRVSL